MNRKLLAAALGKGVEAAAQLRYSDAARMLASNDAIVGDVFSNSEGDLVPTVSTKGRFARWRVEPIQELSDEAGRCIELHVLATDGTGTQEIETHFYVRPDKSGSDPDLSS